jgi:hypothetical protein
MAEIATTPNRVHFASAGVVRRRSSPQPQGVELNHLQLIQALAALTPHRIAGDAEAVETQEVADHCRDLFNALGTYVRAIVDDLADRTIVGIDRTYVSNMLSDTASDIVGHLQRAVDRYEPKPSRILVRMASETAR